jgi:hypothetical protein
LGFFSQQRREARAIIFNFRWLWKLKIVRMANNECSEKEGIFRASLKDNTRLAEHLKASPTLALANCAIY